MKVITITRKTSRKTRSKSSQPRALEWVLRNELPPGGLPAHSGSTSGYPEVTGYMIPSLLELDADTLALRFAEWLVKVQQPDGSFTGVDGRSYVFDTAQVLRGLLAVRRLLPKASTAAWMAAEYLRRQAIEKGGGGFGPRYRGRIPESVHLYALPPLCEAADVFGRAEYDEVAQRCSEFYCSQENAFHSGYLTHYLCYAIDGAIEMERIELVKPLMRKLEARQRRDGSVPGKEGVEWVCTPGLAQLAICWYKLGETEAANLAMSWLDSRQEATGGFKGSYGPGASYFPRVEISWALKFYLDAHALRSGETSRTVETGKPDI